MEVYLQIGALMEKHGLTNQTMTNLTGIPLGTVSGIRSGKIQNPSFDNVCAMMKAMDESIDALVGITPPPVEVNEEKLTVDGYTESEIKAILRWAGSEIARNYQAIVASLEARIAEKDERLSHRTGLMEKEHQRAKEDITAERQRAMSEIQHERKRSLICLVVAFAALGTLAGLFIIDFMLPTVGWIQR